MIDDLFGVAKLLNPRCDDILDEKKLKEREKKDEVSREVKCPKCNQWFKEVNWHTPPSCPHCRHSRVD